MRLRNSDTLWTIITLHVHGSPLVPPHINTIQLYFSPIVENVKKLLWFTSVWQERTMVTEKGRTGRMDSLSGDTFNLLHCECTILDFLLVKAKACCGALEGNLTWLKNKDFYEWQGSNKTEEKHPLKNPPVSGSHKLIQTDIKCQIFHKVTSMEEVLE